MSVLHWNCTRNIVDRNTKNEKHLLLLSSLSYMYVFDTPFYCDKNVGASNTNMFATYCPALKDFQYLWLIINGMIFSYKNLNTTLENLELKWLKFQKMGSQ